MDCAKTCMGHAGQSIQYDSTLQNVSTVSGRHKKNSTGFDGARNTRPRERASLWPVGRGIDARIAKRARAVPSFLLPPAVATGSTQAAVNTSSATIVRVHGSTLPVLGA